MYIENISLVTCTWNNIDVLPGLASGVGITFTQEPTWMFQPLGAVPKHVMVFNPDQSGLVTLTCEQAVRTVKRALMAAKKAEVVGPLVIYDGISKDRFTFNNAVIPQLPDMSHGTESGKNAWTFRYESLIYLPGTE